SPQEQHAGRKIERGNGWAAAPLGSYEPEQPCSAWFTLATSSSTLMRPFASRSPALQSSREFFSSAMLTARISSSMRTKPSPEQSPAHDAIGLVVAVWVVVGTMTVGDDVGVVAPGSVTVAVALGVASAVAVAVRVAVGLTDCVAVTVRVCV